MSRDLQLNDKYTLRYGFNALARLEAPEMLGPLPALMRDPDRAQSIVAQRAFIWAGLLHHHDLTVDQAGDVIDEVGIETCSEKVQAAMSLAYPELFGDGEGDTEKKPKVS